MRRKKLVECGRSYRPKIIYNKLKINIKINIKILKIKILKIKILKIKIFQKKNDTKILIM